MSLCISLVIKLNETLSQVCTLKGITKVERKWSRRLKAVETDIAITLAPVGCTLPRHLQEMNERREHLMTCNRTRPLQTTTYVSNNEDLIKKWQSQVFSNTACLGFYLSLHHEMSPYLLRLTSFHLPLQDGQPKTSNDLYDLQEEALFFTEDLQTMSKFA